MLKRLGKIGKWFGIVVFALIGVLTAIVLWTDHDMTAAESYVKDPSLETIKPGWPGTPIDSRGRFVNVQYPFIGKTADLLRWTLSRNPYAEKKLADTERLPVKDPKEFLAGNGDGILWLGHASFFIRLNGVSMLLDPVFGQPAYIKEYVSVVSPLDQIKNVDLILLSHDHRDHTDEPTLKAIANRFPNAVFLGGLGMDDLFNDWKTPSNGVSTAGWYQKFDHRSGKVEIFFVPVRHWSRRGLFDTNRRLWGGYVIRSDKTSIYFGGDSGYGDHYSEVGSIFPQIDYFLIGIGAYEPRWFMEPNHNSPIDAIKAFKDIGAKNLVPMHYGRFDLSDEPPNEPIRALRLEAEKAGLTDKLKVITINEHISTDGGAAK